MPTHLIFEGAELTGKSFIISQIYNYLEKKYNTSRNILNGCHWLNLDVGILGGEKASDYIKKYLPILSLLQDQNLILEKFHLSDQVYQKIYNQKDIEYPLVEEELKKMDFKIILCSTQKDQNLIQRRIKDRINLYPHYQRILRPVEKYLEQQYLYSELIKKSKLAYLEVDLTDLPNPKVVDQIIQYIS